jgi:hypothetical protein
MIKAIASYGPRVELQRTIQTRQLAGYIQGRTSLNRGEVENVLSELNEAIIFFARQGAPVKLGGVGIFTPSVNLGGALGIGFRLDNDIDSMLNVDTLFTGVIKNRENVGKSPDELKAMWNEEHPDDIIA